MIEIHIRLKIDTNDPREAYLQAMGALAFSGHEHVVSDYWLINGKPLPKQVAQTVKQCNGRRDTNRIDPHIQSALENLHDLAVAFTDEDNPEAIGIMEELDVLVDNAIPMNPVPEVTQCVTPEERYLQDHNMFHRVLSPIPEPEYTPMFQRVLSVAELKGLPMPDNIESMRAMNSLVLSALMPRGCIHEQVDFDLTEDRTPMFRAMMDKSVDFDVGTAEEIPLSAIDVEICDLMGELEDGNG